MTDVIRTRLLTKTFGRQDVVSNVTMKVRKGEIYGFLGPNGAGKSTLMKMLLGLVKPTGGEIELFGERQLPGAVEPLKRIGHMIEAPVFYEKLTAEQNLELHAEYMGYYRAGAAKEALDLVQLIGVENKPVKQFSLGMRQRLGIARAIMTRPELLLLDEPINGLDPEGIQEMRVLFRRLRDELGTTLLISSHLLAEVEQVADTVGILDRGRLLQEVSMESIRRSNTDYVEIKTSNAQQAALVLEEKLQIRHYKIMGSHMLRVYDADVTPEALSKGLVLNDVSVESIIRRHHSLEEYFLELTRGGGGHAAFDQAGA
ncbi:ATP-binding cassette domain-containing protein [Paenibacillus soyae]|uniref:ATP-binding cassette domain-containing protein n=1 Tax=Paenibacillus soyae TaxID=2969249 RepID=A0A9X2MVK7_9BACL|nr:ATP-binding cassette domain-containing protein [Paenibacillus soyae]MCR2807152.1 ATP-binding cassette domain-containing protein [Paenibacillus soyae]